MPDTGTIKGALLALFHELGREDRGLAILGEGNTSARLSTDAFLVKASGSNLATLPARPALVHPKLTMMACD